MVLIFKIGSLNIDSDSEFAGFGPFHFEFGSKFWI